MGPTDVDYEADAWRGADEATAECERLRGLLTIARDGLVSALMYLECEDHDHPELRHGADALRRSNPDAITGEAPQC